MRLQPADAGDKFLNQAKVKPSVKLFGLGDRPFMKGSVQRRKRFELVIE